MIRRQARSTHNERNLRQSARSHEMRAESIARNSRIRFHENLQMRRVWIKK